ncbi:MAG: hypothetical protein ACKO3K_04735 [Cuspidothrix sp.]
MRHRWVFHSVSDLISKDTNQTTLVVINSKAWGHLMRLAYYTNPKYPVMLLSEKPANLAATLEKVLQENPAKYNRVMWLDSRNPVWSKLETETEVEQAKQKMEKVFSSQFKLIETKNLSGTMILDDFTARLYLKPPKT